MLDLLSRSCSFLFISRLTAARPWLELELILNEFANISDGVRRRPGGAETLRSRTKLGENEKGKLRLPGALQLSACRRFCAEGRGGRVILCVESSTSVLLRRQAWRFRTGGAAAIASSTKLPFWLLRAGRSTPGVTSLDSLGLGVDSSLSTCAGWSS